MDSTRFESVLATLNPGQSAAVDRLSDGWQGNNGSVRLTIVDGPPGTGKTHVAACAAGRWVLERRGRVVVLCPTHAAGQRVQEKMLDVGFVNDQVLHLKPGAPQHDPHTGVLRFENVDQLPPNLRRLLQQADVVITTWHGSKRAFDAVTGFLLLVDEVSQVSFAALLAILKRVRHRRLSGFGLLGDPQQLPVIATQEILATNAAIGILRRHPECHPCRLDLQYRMNSSICAVVNDVRLKAFGGAPLQAGNQHVGERTLDQVTNRYEPQGSPFPDILDPQASVVFVDTAPLAAHGAAPERAVGTSWEYEVEAHLAVRLAEAVEQAFGDGDDPTIAASSPYAAQVALMRRLGARNCKTIYQAQGQEWDCVILSFARTMGLTIMDQVYQNIYVGLSRARSKLIVLLNVDFFGPSHRVIGSILRLVESVPGVTLVRADPAWVKS